MELQFRFTDILMILGWFGSFVFIVFSQREQLTEEKAKTAGEIALLKQADANLESKLDDDRRRSDQHWGEVKNTLDKIMDKLDGKADKHA